MSARNYMPYIPEMMEHIQRIYEWNERVDEMRMKSLEIPSIEDYYTFGTYDFKNGLRMYYEERGEHTTAKLEDNLPDQVDALVDQFVVAIGEIRKCALSESYEHIDFWEARAKEADWEMDAIISNLFKFENIEQIEQAKKLLHRCFREVIDKLFTRFGADCYIDENGKFKKSTDFQEPDFSFLQ